MSPTGSGAPAVPAAPTDPRELALHLEICRLQAELEGLEARIHEVEQARASGGSGYDPFVERAEELVERMVSSLYVSGRSEIAASAAATDEEAEALLVDARRRAQAILAEARGELAAVLSARADAMDAARAAGLDVVDLTGDQHALDLAPVAAAPETLDHPDALEEGEAPEALQAPEAGPWVEQGEAVEGSVDAAGTPEAAAGVAAGLQLDEWAEPAPVLVDPVGPDPSASPVLAPPPPPPPGTLAEPVEAVAVDTQDAEAVLPPPPPAAPADGWLPPSTEAEEAPAGSLTAALVAARTETDRTDAAFDAWLAVAPPEATTAEAPAELDAEAPTRPAWVRPLEAAIALMAVAVVVVLALLLVG